jgi:hypothetical protein
MQARFMTQNQLFTQTNVVKQTSTIVKGRLISMWMLNTYIPFHNKVWQFSKTCIVGWGQSTEINYMLSETTKSKYIEVKKNINIYLTDKGL